MLGSGGPVGVDRLDVIGVGLAAPAQQEALGDRLGLVDLLLRHGRLAGAACRLRHERQRHHGRTRQVGAGLLVGAVDQLLQAPLGSEHRQAGLHVDARVAGADRQRVGLGRWQARQEGAVDQQAPDVLVGNLADQILDIDTAVAQRAAFFVGLRDLGREGDHAFEAGLNFELRFGHFAPCRS